MNILVLCTYPVGTPRHGGQLRVKSIIDVYRQAGHTVRVAGVLGSEVYEKERGFVPFPGHRELTSILPHPFLMEDFAIGQLFTKSVDHYVQLERNIDVTPDVIHVEQPWLFAFAQKFVAGRAPQAKIVYSSHNVEWRLKAQILKASVNNDDIQRYVELVRAIELEAIDGAQAITCVSEFDATWLREQTSRPVFVFPNGVAPWHATDSGIDEAKRVSKGLKYALYCASAHPPNVTGFFSML